MLSKATTRLFYRKLYGGMLKTITILKRGDDQKQGSIVSYILYGCRRKKIYHEGEPIQRDMASADETVWQIPRAELDRVGILYLNAADTIVESVRNLTKPRYWRPEANTMITDQLYENILNLDCVRCDPPG